MSKVSWALTNGGTPCCCEPFGCPSLEGCQDAPPGFSTSYLLCRVDPPYPITSWCIWDGVCGDTSTGDILNQTDDCKWEAFDLTASDFYGYQYVFDVTLDYDYEVPEWRLTFTCKSWSNSDPSAPAPDAFVYSPTVMHKYLVSTCYPNGYLETGESWPGNGQYGAEYGDGVYVV